jgi:hypothetical protein
MLRLLGLALLALVVAGVVAAALRAVAPEAEGDSDEERVAVPRRAAVENGVVVLTISAEEQRAGGIEVATLEPMRWQPEARGFASVLEPGPLVEARTNRIATVIEAQRAAAALDAAHQAVGRLAPLNRENRIVSDKDLLAARTEEAAGHAAWQLAEERKRLGAIALRRDWGDAVGGWLAEGGPELDALLDGRTLLLRVALADPARAGTPGPAAELTLAGGSRAQAEIVGAAPQADPKFPGPALFALAKPDSGLRPGASAAAVIPWGAPLAGVFVRSAAIIRFDGRLWVYAAVRSDRFERRELPDATPVRGGWIAATGLEPGARVVVTGAQLLLSEELRGAAGG